MGTLVVGGRCLQMLIELINSFYSLLSEVIQSVYECNISIKLIMTKVKNTPNGAQSASFHVDVIYLTLYKVACFVIILWPHFFAVVLCRCDPL